MAIIGQYDPALVAEIRATRPDIPSNWYFTGQRWLDLLAHGGDFCAAYTCCTSQVNLAQERCDVDAMVRWSVRLLALDAYAAGFSKPDPRYHASEDRSIEQTGTERGMVESPEFIGVNHALLHRMEWDESHRELEEFRRFWLALATAHSGEF
jgi:hypothetical protein